MDARELDALEKATRHDATALQPCKAAIMELSASPRKDVRWHVAQMLPRLKLRSRSERRTRATLLLRWLEEDESTFVRVSSLQALVELARQEPKLRADVRSRLEACLADRSAAVRARARKLIAS